jgi:hypothetical protein
MHFAVTKGQYVVIKVEMDQTHAASPQTSAVLFNHRTAGAVLQGQHAGMVPLANATLLRFNYGVWQI